MVWVYEIIFFAQFMPQGKEFAYFTDFYNRNRQGSGWGRDEVTYFFFVNIGTKYAEISGKKFQTFHCNNVTTMKSLELFHRNFR